MLQSIINAKKLILRTFIGIMLTLSLFTSTSASAQYVDIVTYLKQTAAQLTWEKLQAKANEAVQRELQKKATELSSAATAKLNTQIQTTLGDALKGPVGKLLQNSGVDLTKVKDAATTVQKRIDDMTKATNPVELQAAIAADAVTTQLMDRLNVYSMLDEKPAIGTCKNTTAEKCTILTILREQDAVALDALQRQNIASVAAQVAQKGQWGSTMLAQVDRLAGKTDLNVLAFLTPAPSLPLGFEANSQTAPTLEKSMWLSQILIGTKNDSQFLTRVAQDRRGPGTDDTSQIDAMSKIAKIQLARSAILNVHNEFTNASLNSQFRACVVRPDAQDRLSPPASQEQHLVHIQSLLRCNNMIMLQLRQQELEGQRLQGAMLLTLLDLYAVQEPKSK